MKTIKNLADEIGVSKTAINKKIDNLGLRQLLQKVSGSWLIPEDIEISIKDAFNRKPKPQIETANSLRQDDTLVYTILEKQLAEKDKQIAELQAQLSTMQTLLDHEQQLRMVTEQKLIAAAPDPEPEPPEQKKKWWQWWKGTK